MFKLSILFHTFDLYILIQVLLTSTLIQCHMGARKQKLVLVCVCVCMCVCVCVYVCVCVCVCVCVFAHYNFISDTGRECCQNDVMKNIFNMAYVQILWISDFQTLSDDRRYCVLNCDTNLNDLHLQSGSQGYEKARTCTVILLQSDMR